MHKIYVLSVLLSISFAQAMLEPSAKKPLFISVSGAQMPHVNQKFVELRKIAVSPNGDVVAIQPTQLTTAYCKIFDRKKGKLIDSEDLIESYSQSIVRRVSNICFGTNEDFYCTNKYTTYQLIRKEDVFSCTNSKFLQRVNTLAVHPSGKMLCSALASGAIEFRSTSLECGSLLQATEGTESQSFFFECEEDSEDSESGPLSLKCKGVIKTDMKKPINFAFNHDGTLVYATPKNPSSYKEFSLFVWSLESVKRELSYDGDRPMLTMPVDSPITAMDAYGKDYILSGHDDGKVRLWDVRNPRTAAITSQITSDRIEALHAFGDGGYAVHVLDRNGADSTLVVADTLGYKADFVFNDPSVAYVYDKANHKLLCASGDDEITELDVHAIKKCEQ